MEVVRTVDPAVVRSIVSAHLGLRPEEVTPEIEVPVRVRLQPGDDDPMLRSLHIHFGTDFSALTHRRVHWSTILTLSPVAAGIERTLSKAVIRQFPPDPPWWGEHVASLVVLLVAWGLLSLVAVLWMSTRPPGEERVKFSQIEEATRRGHW